LEKILVKTGIYSFIISFFLFVVFFKREKLTTDVDGMSSYEITPFPQYFFQIFRYSVIISIIAVVVASYVYYLNNGNKWKKSPEGND
jgi:ABC-type spermidine/putrescine transport system permease subunit I